MKKIVKVAALCLIACCVVAALILPYITKTGFAEGTTPGSEATSNSTTGQNTTAAPGTTAVPGTTAAPSEPEDEGSCTVTFSVVNGQATTEDGEPITSPLPAEKDTVVSFRVQPADGCEIVSVTAQNAAVSNTDGVYTLTVTQDTEISILCEDTQDPQIQSILRESEDWKKEVCYEISCSDNMGIATVIVTNHEGEQLPVVEEDGLYVATVTVNGTYAVTVTDLNGLTDTQTFEEDHLDNTGPQIQEPVRSEAGWHPEVQISFSVTDSQSGIASVRLMLQGQEQALEKTGGDDFAATLKENGTYTIIAIDNAGNETRLTYSEGQVDNEAPNVSEPDRNTQRWSTYADYTFHAEDPLSGIASVVLTKENSGEIPTLSSGSSYSFRITENGTYTLTITDNTGNETKKQIVEEKVDTDDPVMSTPVRTRDSWQKSPEYTFTVSDQTSHVSVTVTGNNGSFSVTPNENGFCVFTVNENGEYAVTVTDAAGNTVVETFRETLADTAPPVIEDVYRTSTEWKTEVTYTFRVSDSQSGIQSVQVILDAETMYAATPDPNGNCSLTIRQNGPYEILVTDHSGQTTSAYFTESKIDTEKPHISAAVREETGWTQSTRYSFTVTDSQSGIKSVYLIAGEDDPVELFPGADYAYRFTVDANDRYQIIATDIAGQKSELTIVETQIDEAAPAVSQADREHEQWARTAKYSFIASDEHSGISSVVCTGPNGAAAAVVADGNTYSLTVAANGTYTVTVTDNTGRHTQHTFREEHLDLTDPEISAPDRNTASWTQAATYSFTVTDSQSGISSVTVTPAGGEARTLEAVYGIYSFTADQNVRYSITATDNVGNQFSLQIQEVGIDTEKPVIETPERNTDTWSQSATYSFAASDSQSGIASVTVKLGDAEPKTLTQNGGLYTFTVSANVTCEIRVTDNTGREQACTITEEQIDTEAPSLTAPNRKHGDWAQSVLYSFTATDSQSGIASVTVTPAGGMAQQLNESNGVYSFTAEANIRYTVTVTDAVGRTSVMTITEERIDLTAPAVTAPERESELWLTEASYSFQATDAQAGINTVTVTLNGKRIDVTADPEGGYSFTVKENGIYTITVTDFAGNITVLTVTDDHIDYTKPVIDSVKPQTEWDAEANSVTVIVTDDGEIASVTVTSASGKSFPMVGSNSTYTLMLTANGEYTVTVTDKAGNHTEESFTIDRIDTEAPETPTLSSTGKEQWVNVDVTLTAKAKDPDSGITAYWYSRDKADFDKNTWQRMSLAELIGTITLTKEEDTVYYVVAEDAVGRISKAAKIRVAIDKTAPSDLWLDYLTGAGSGYNKTANDLLIYNDKLTFQAGASDSASGVTGYEYRVEGTGFDIHWTKVTADSKGFREIITGADSICSVYIRACDEAGNWSEPYTLGGSDPAKAVLENTPEKDTEKAPVPSVTAQTGTRYTGTWTNESVRISVSGSAAISGIAGYEYRLDNADPERKDTGWQAVPNEDALHQLLIDSNFNGTCWVRAVTFADNRSQETKLTIRVQKTVPEAPQILADTATGGNGWHTVFPNYEIKLAEQDPYQAPVSYTIRHTFNGVAGQEIQYNGKNAPVLNKDGKWTVSILVTDAAGNETVSQTYGFNIDTNAPAGIFVTMEDQDILLQSDTVVNWDKVNIQDLTVFADFTIFRNSSVKILAGANGGDSGAAAIYYQLTKHKEEYDLDGQWTTLPESGLVLTPDSRNLLHFKAVDPAGNVTYFSAEGILLDASAPSGTDGGQLTILPQNENLSKHGYYSADATIAIQVCEPVVSTDTFAGLQSISYRVMTDGQVTQEGILYPDTGKAQYLDGRINTWSGSIRIDSQKNNSNQVIVEVTATDMAGNQTVTRTQDGQIRIDITPPEITGSYDRNDAEAEKDGILYFTGSRKLTIRVKERNFVPDEALIFVTDTDTDSIAVYSWKEVADDYVAEIAVAKDGHYTVTVQIQDAAGNVQEKILFQEGTKSAEAFVIDNTAPEILVTYDNNDAVNDKYFAGSRTVTIHVTERNFSAEKVQALLTAALTNGKSENISFSSWSSSGNIHTATATCKTDGVYTLSVSGSDLLGNIPKRINYTGTAATDWVIDTKANAPKFIGIKNGSAYNSDLIPTFEIRDWNLSTVQIRLTRTVRDEIGKDITEDVTEKFVLKHTETGATGTLDIFPKEQIWDGIYTLTVSYTDMAGNASEKSITFSVNRFGSTYAYEEYLAQINGAYLQAVDKDLIITEYNPSQIAEGSTQVYITKDGSIVAAPIFTVTAVPDGSNKPGSSGWYEYRYEISKENFLEDGTYEVVITSKDAAGNIPENTDEYTRISFSVDTTPPELPSIVGMESAIMKADSIEVTLTAQDNVALKSLTVYLNGEQLAHWDALTSYHTELVFRIPAGYQQNLRIVAEDCSGNVLDTGAADFDPGYAFEDTITVSTNMALRFYANKPLFFGAIAGTVLTACLFLLLIILRKKKKKEADAEN